MQTYFVKRKRDCLGPIGAKRLNLGGRREGGPDRLFIIFLISTNILFILNEYSIYQYIFLTNISIYIYIEIFVKYNISIFSLSSTNIYPIDSKLLNLDGKEARHSLFIPKTKYEPLQWADTSPAFFFISP